MLWLFMKHVCVCAHVFKSVFNFGQLPGLVPAVFFADFFNGCHYLLPRGEKV